jgi:hypothetical protein
MQIKDQSKLGSREQVRIENTAIQRSGTQAVLLGEDALQKALVELSEAGIG